MSGTIGALTWWSIRSSFGRLDSHYTRADPAKARAKLGWQPQVSFEGLIKMMVDARVETLLARRRRAHRLVCGRHVGPANCRIGSLDAEAWFRRTPRPADRGPADRVPPPLPAPRTAASTTIATAAQPGGGSNRVMTTAADRQSSSSASGLRTQRHLATVGKPGGAAERIAEDAVREIGGVGLARVGIAAEPILHLEFRLAAADDLIAAVGAADRRRGAAGIDEDVGPRREQRNRERRQERQRCRRAASARATAPATGTRRRRERARAAAPSARRPVPPTIPPSFPRPRSSSRARSS